MECFSSGDDFWAEGVEVEEFVDIVHIAFDDRVVFFEPAVEEGYHFALFAAVLEVSFFDGDGSVPFAYGAVDGCEGDASSAHSGITVT